MLWPYPRAGVSSSRPDPEIPAKAKRRSFTAAFKKEVLAEYEAAADGKKGEVLRRRGVSSWHIADWRNARPATVPHRARPGR
ncbi:hypothetical protein ABZT43_50475 [Streptomyces sp. NPDC005349]|uniref:hypothetical protein n=1 Tax=Streptomyces sp. NPDC005349 TaxID=3157037 RepID=UPI0033A88D85